MPKTLSRARRSLPLVGAVVAAFGASACCTVPLLAVLLGLSASTTAASLGPLRPVFLLGSAALLLVGGRRLLAPSPAKEEGCCPPERRSVGAIAVVVVAVVAAVALSFGPELLAGSR